MRISNMRTLGMLALTLLLGASVTVAEPVVYEATGNDLFGTIDLGTGVFNPIGPMGSLLSGLGEDAAGNVYGGLDLSTTLEKVNTSTGALTVVGSGAWAYLDTGSTTTGVYGLDPNMRLFSVDTTTGATTLIGNTGVGDNGTLGLSTNSATLYLTDAGVLYTIDTTTGHATPVGSTGVGGIGALIGVDNTLFGGENRPTLNVDTLDPLTGIATVGPPVTGTTAAFWGLAPTEGLNAAAVPEPGSLGMILLSGAFLIGAAIRPKRRKEQ